ncbi:MAG: hypothetical protein LBP28_01720 [Coriobacteriales bacterium]|nr:hypothetical protein [Coriobacteriales bacterium]
MATESIGKTIHLTNEQADQLASEIARVDSEPPRQRTTKIKWGDPKNFMRALEREYLGSSKS